MALVLKPPQRRLLPNGKLKIDWSHPLANGLVACWVPGISAGINIVGDGGDLSPVNASGTVTIPAISREGAGWTTGKSGDGLRGTLPSSMQFNIASLYWRGTFSSVTSGGVCLIGVDYDNAISAPFVAYTIETTFSGSDGPPIEVAWNSGGTLHITSSTAINGSVGDGTINSFCATFKPGGNVVLYKAGAQVVSTTFGASNPTFTATSAISLNSEIADNNRVLGATALIACIWNRELTADEAALLDADPYGFLIPAEGEMPALFLPAVSTSGGARIRQRWNRSPLAYPAGAVPGVDRSHPVVKGLIGSVIPMGNSNNAVNLGGSPFQVGTSGVGVTATMDGTIGPACTFNPGAGTGFPIRFTGTPVPNDPMNTGDGFTFATIFRAVNGGAGNNNMSGCALGQATGVYQTIIGASGNFGLRWASNVSYDSGIPAVYGAPYFHIATARFNGSNIIHSHVILRLDTGTLTVVNPITTASAAPSGFGSFLWGGSNPAAGSVGVNTIAASLVTTTILTMPQMLQFAADPWSFWYPNKTINLASSTASAGASFLPVWAYRYNLPVLGTGNF